MRHLNIVLISVLFFFSVSFSQDDLSLINAYSDSLNKFEQIAYDSNNIQLVEYLNECEEFLEFFTKEKNDPRLINYNVPSRIRLRNELMSAVQDIPVRTIMLKEQELYNSLVQDIAYKDLIYALKARSILADRKFFEKDDESKGTIIELWLNGAFKFTSTKLTDLQGPQYGIKNWEISARFEPIGFIVNKDWTGVLFSFGTIYNFFPILQQKNDDVKVQDTFYSKYIKRSGIKLGVGGRFEDEFIVNAGAGLQVRAFTFWSLYSFENKKVYYAVGINDLSWVKFFIPYVNIGF
ncbi:MAG: hypothetical protein JW956_02395 [Calditrichaceae bacterium]|nr:hypothetical protein [Calditrichaceae bacterium]